MQTQKLNNTIYATLKSNKMGKNSKVNSFRWLVVDNSTSLTNLNLYKRYKSYQDWLNKNKEVK